MLPLVALALVACGESDDADAGGGDQGQQETQACQRAVKDLVSAIETGLTVTGSGGLRRAYIVRSDDFEKVYMVAAEIQGAGLEGGGDIGVWAKSGPPKVGGGLILAVDTTAQEFSDWGDADKTDASIDESAAGVNEARACTEGG